MKPWQFITFILPQIGGRSYSVTEILWNTVVLTIKRRDTQNGGRWGSQLLCDSEPWETYKCVWPAWHFVLNESSWNKLFLGTGTGLVPLYNQIVSGLQKKTWEHYKLFFGVRYLKDLFYIERLQQIKQSYPDTFNFTVFISREWWDASMQQWYITDGITADEISNFDEYYICWAPAMIESSEKKLTELWVEREKISFEKYV